MDKHLQAFVIFDIPHGPARKSDEERERGGECVCALEIMTWFGGMAFWIQ